MRVLGGLIAASLLIGALAPGANAQPPETEMVVVVAAERPGLPDWLISIAWIISAIGLLLSIYLSHRIDREVHPDGVSWWTKPLRVIGNIAHRESDSAYAKSLRTFLHYAAAAIYLPWLFIWQAQDSRDIRAQRAADAHVERLIAENIHSPRTVFVYALTNSDKSSPQTILVRIKAPFEVEVAHLSQPCVRPVIADVVFDSQSRNAKTISLGRLNRDGSRSPDISLANDSDSGTFAVQHASIQTSPAIYDAPYASWRLYSLALADFIFAGPRARETFTFGLVGDVGEPSDHVFRNLGEVRADYWFGSSSGKLTFNFSGPAFTTADGKQKGGLVVFDEAHGHVIRADLKTAAHPGRQGLRLRLEEIRPLSLGDESWRNALTRHWQGCPG